jgi:hypothetical protein
MERATRPQFKNRKSQTPGTVDGNMNRSRGLANLHLPVYADQGESC